LADRFVKAAIPIVRVIVMERHLNIANQTIKPAQIGGIAGGQKYIKNNIFFKFSKDNESGMYGGNEWAMKAAGN
jgi:hypothetical protein